MSEKSASKTAVRRLVWLAGIIAVLAALLGVNSFTGGANLFAPKLALDLQGGTQIILSPTLAEGQSVSEEQLAQAVEIIRQRVDATGVSEAQILTRGSANIEVSIPGTPDENTLKLIRSSAKLDFRPVLVTSVASTSTADSGSSEQTPAPSASPSNGSDLNWVTPELKAAYDALDCTSNFRQPGQVDDPAVALVTCDVDGYAKYILGPVEVDGANISDATAGTRTTSTGASTNEWVVNLELDDAGTKKFADVTQRLYPLESPRNQFAVSLDGYVIIAPSTNAVITNGNAEISGGFTKDSSKVLADQLKYGSLPIGFEVQSQENISATLGSEQLSGGLLAGIIGLILVIIYSVFQYRALAIVTIGSLAVAGIFTYLAIAVLSWRQDYRLSLAGVAGLIMSIGITADSFIVYFERVRDELREGKSLPQAIEVGWKRAVRTILVSGLVSLTAAAVLYVLTVGNVKGFAFTLGLTTLIDLAIAIMFTHPLLQLLSRTSFFNSGHKFSGVDPRALGALNYRGRGQFQAAESLPKTAALKASKEANKRQTLAERKAAAGKESK